MKCEPADLMLYALAAVVTAPLLVGLIAVGIDLSVWVFTGHQVFPWIGHAFSQKSTS